MAIKSYFFNSVDSDRTYNAEDFCSYLQQIIGNGVFPNPSTSLQVRANSGMQIFVGAGQGWINGHKMINTADYSLTVSTASASNPRIDTVVFFLDLTNRTMGLRIKTGTAEASPTTPDLTRTASVYELGLANIYVSKGATAITANVITDTRMDSNRCGMVQGLIQQVDTTTLWEQQDAEFHQWMIDVVDQYIEAGGAPVPVITTLRGSKTTQSKQEVKIGSFTVKKGINHIVLRCDFGLHNGATGACRVYIKRSTNPESLSGEAWDQIWHSGQAQEVLIIDKWMFVSESERSYDLYAYQESNANCRFQCTGELVNLSPVYTFLGVVDIQ